MQEDEEATERLRIIAERFSQDPMDPLMREMFAGVKKELILSMIGTGVALGINKGQDIIKQIYDGASPPSRDNITLIVEATAKEVYSMREEQLDIIFSI